MTDLIFYHDDIYKGSLILVNRDYPLVQSKKPDLRPAVDSFSNIPMEINAANILSLLLDAVNSENAIIPVSGYRTPEEQSRIYNHSLNENGAEFTDRYVALPYHSEHHTGLAIDLAMKQDHIDFIRPYFPYEGICNDFRKLAPLYGFIERYPLGKENITGIAHEPWHFRYVGFPHSKLISERGISLEEYIEDLRSYSYGGKHLYYKHHNQVIEIFYICLSNVYSTKISIRENTLYQVSGNNVDGVIITIWRKSNE